MSVCLWDGQPYAGGRCACVVHNERRAREDLVLAEIAGDEPFPERNQHRLKARRIINGLATLVEHAEAAR